MCCCGTASYQLGKLLFMDMMYKQEESLVVYKRKLATLEMKRAFECSSKHGEVK